MKTKHNCPRLIRNRRDLHENQGQVFSLPTCTFLVSIDFPDQNTLMIQNTTEYKGIQGNTTAHTYTHTFPVLSLFHGLNLQQVSSGAVREAILY